MSKIPKSVGVSEYWSRWLQSIVDSGIRHSKAQIVAESLARHRAFIEREKEEFIQIKEEIKERRESKQ